MRTVSALSVLSLLLLTNTASAVPLQVSHQGRLLDSEDAPLEGTHTLEFTIWNAATEGSSVFSEAIEVAIVNGYYSVVLGTDPVNPLDEGVLSGEALFVSLTIDDSDELLPRQRLTSAPYAIMSGTAENLRGGSVDATSLSIDGTPVIDASGTWVGPAVGDTLSGITCDANDVARFDGSNWACVDASTLNSTLTEGQVETFVTNGALNLATGTTVGGGAISVGDHTVNTNAASICPDAQYLRGDGMCVAGFLDADGIDATNDTVSSSELDALCSTDGQILVRTGGAWACGDDDGLTGTGASGALASFDASGNLRGSAVFEVAGQVGINDSSPSAELDVTGDTRLDGALTVTGGIDVGGDSTITGDSDVDGAMTVAGHTQLDSTLTVAGDAQVDGALTVTGNVTGLSVSLTGCAWVEDDCETDGTELVYLDRANNLTCPANQVLTDWNVENCGGGEFRMRFNCCSLTVQ